MVLVGVAIPAAASAWPTADPTWGDDGSVTTTITRGPRSLTGLRLDAVLVANGQVWISGAASPAGPVHKRGGPSGGVFVARYLGDGSLDASFGADGILRRRGLWDMQLALATPGGILANEWPLHGPLRLVRLRNDGAEDPRFHVVLPRGVRQLGGCTFNLRGVQAIVRQPDGKIVAIAAGGAAKRIVRLTPSGQPDLTFGDGGAARVRLPTGPRPQYGAPGAHGVALEPDGSLLVAVGYAEYCCTDEPLQLERLNADGELDPSFGQDGVVTLPKVQ